MNYSEVLDFLYKSLPAYQRIGKAAYKSNLDTTLDLDSYFESPHKHYYTIHIAGTNGKGSVSSILASILKSAGYKTGLYTSPHLSDFSERIRVDGRPVEKEYIVDFVNKHKEILTELKPSFFEMTVAMAFLYFAHSNVDIAVIETGMGGRLDSTNIITPLLSIITNIGFDHTQFLGTTLEAIAGEKAGIIKKGVPLVVGRKDAEYSGLIERIAKEKNSELVFAGDLYRAEKTVPDYSSGSLSLDIYSKGKLLYPKLLCDQAGLYQEENIVTAICATGMLADKLKISDNDIRKGLAATRENSGLRGRWQVLGHKPLVICDTAHNFDGLRRVISQLEGIRAARYRFVLGFVDDKDLDKLLPLFKPEHRYYFTRSSVPRSAGAEYVAEIAGKYGLKGKVFTSVKDAYSSALAACGTDDVLYVGGSTFIVADLLDYIDNSL